MGKRFGDFKTVEELNRTAAAKKAEGDREAVVALAIENGLDREDAEDYLDGVADEFCTPEMAALGKLELEAKELDIKSQMKDWKDYIAGLVIEWEDEELARAVFRPDKKLLDVLAAGLKRASENRVKIDARIVKAAGLPDGAAQIGMCGRDDLRRIVTDYYLGGKKDAGV